MIAVTHSRSGALTEVTATIADAAVLPMVQAAFQAATSRFTARDGLVQSVRCKGSEASRLMAALASINVPAPVQSAPAVGTWQARRMILSSARRSAEPTIASSLGGVLSLTGFGREFTGQEQDGCLWGETVCYAYYA